MRFGRPARWRKWRARLPDWVSHVAPTVAVIIGASLVVALPVVALAGWKHLALVAMGLGLPVIPLLLLSVFLTLGGRKGGGRSDGGGGSPPPPDRPPDEPPWWPDFEESFRRYVIGVSGRGETTVISEHHDSDRAPVGSGIRR